VYHIEIVIDGDLSDQEPLAIVDIFNDGRIYAEAALPLAEPLRFIAENFGALEIRVRALGHAFRLGEVRLGQTLSPSRAQRIAQGARPDPDRPGDIDTERVWRMLHTPGLLEADHVARGRELDPLEVDAWARRQPHTIHHQAESVDFIDAAVALDIDTDALRLAGRHDRALETLYARSHSEPALAARIANMPTLPAFHSHFMRQLARHTGDFQVSALASGYVSLVCPFTGLLLKSRHAFPVATDDSKQVHILYRFESAEVFYLAVGNFTATKSFIYHPRSETIIHLHDTEMAWGVAEHVILQFRQLVMAMAGEVIAYLRSETERTLLVDVTNNLGHVFWNDGGGIFEAERCGLLDNVRRALRYRFRLFDTLALANRHFDVVEAQTAHELMGAALRERAFCVRPATIAFPEGLPERIRQVAIEHCSDLIRRRLRVAREADCLVWVNLRAHNKVWRNQVDGIVAVAEDLAIRHDRVALFLDGTPDCAGLAAEITARLPRSVEAYDGLSLTIYESTAFATIVDFYIATIGSGLTLVTWIAQKDGVAHSERAHLGQLDFWGEVQPNAPAPLAPAVDQIEELGSGMYCDYLIEPQVIVDLVRRVDDARSKSSSMLDSE
jgi:hypothetical protein